MKYTYTFDYEEGWMILLYKDGRYVKYFNSAEDDWDKSVRALELFDAPYENRFYYKLNSYEDVEDIDVFNLDCHGIEKFIRG